MTTFQDPPPQSRRSARQSERGEQQAEQAPYQFTGEQPYAQAPQGMPAQPQPTAPVQPDAAPTSGRRARAAEPQAPIAEPLNYTTQGRDPAAYEAQLPAAGYAPAPQEPAAYRVRDFSPEGTGRRAAAPPLIEPQQAQGAPGASDLHYRTQAGPAAPDASAHPTLSRRELRQRQAEAEAAAGIAPQGMAPQGVAPQAYAAAPGAPAPVNPALVTQPPQLRTAPPPTMPPVQPAAPLDFQSAPPPTLAPTPTMSTPPGPVGPPSTVTAPPAQRTALSDAMAEFEALTRTGQPPAPSAQPPAGDQTVVNTGQWVAPVGHWSRQADLDDETQPWENTITREVGGGNVATTTSALVLPEIPRPTSFSTALDSTGEVLLTGSIDLPQSLSAGGGDPRRYDDANVDLMYDTQDAEFTGTDSSPVRAVRAVSTHTSSRGVIHANKPHGNRLIVVAFVATAVIAVGVVALLVASLVLNVF